MPAAPCIGNYRACPSHLSTLPADQLQNLPSLFPICLLENGIAVLGSPAQKPKSCICLNEPKGPKKSQKGPKKSQKEPERTHFRWGLSHHRTGVDTCPFSQGSQCPRGSWQRKSHSPLSRRRGTRRVIFHTPPRGAQLHLNRFFWLRQTQGIPCLPSCSPFNSKAR